MLGRTRSDIHSIMSASVLRNGTLVSCRHQRVDAVVCRDRFGDRLLERLTARRSRLRDRDLCLFRGDGSRLLRRRSRLRERERRRKDSKSRSTILSRAASEALSRAVGIPSTASSKIAFVDGRTRMPSSPSLARTASASAGLSNRTRVFIWIPWLL